MASNHRVTDLDKIPVQISKDEAPTPLSVVGPLFILSLLFHLYRTLLGAWRFSLFRSVYSSFHNGLDLIREAAFYWVFCFIFPIILVCFIIMIICKKFFLQKSFYFNRLVISWPPRIWGWAIVTGSCHSLFFLLACPFVFWVMSFIYDVWVRGVVSMFNETAHSFFVWVVREHLLPCRVIVTAKWVESCTRIMCIQPLSHCSLTLLASSFSFQKVLLLFCLCFLFHHAFFLFYLWLIGHFVPAC